MGRIAQLLGRSERRQSSQTWVDALLQHRASVAAGETTATDVQALAVVEIAAGLWSRGLAAGVSDRLEAHQLAQIGNDLCRRGNSIWLALEDGSIVAAADWDISGEGVAPETWSYRLTLAGPSGHAVRVAGSDRVLHFRVGVNSRAPYKGRAPWANAPISAALAAKLEASMTEEVGGPVGSILPVPDLKAAAGIAEQLPKLGGRTVLAETTQSGWEAGGRGPVPREWEPRRVGANPPDALRALRADVQASMLAAAGVPVELSAGGSGAGAREAWRRFLHSTIGPVGRIVGAEVGRVLGGDGELSFEQLAASDLTGRARAYRSLRDAGMDDAAARRICGFDIGG